MLVQFVSAALPAEAAPKKQIPILAWVGPPANHTTVERYRELAAAGFTHNFSPFPNPEAMAKGLDVARKTGIRQFVSLPELATDPEGMARRFRGHPALAGYHLRDEPSAGDFAELATWTKRIQAVDPEHGCYINLFPNYATPAQLGSPSYTAHVEQFLREVPVPYLSFDHYPVLMRNACGRSGTRTWRSPRRRPASDTHVTDVERVGGPVHLRRNGHFPNAVHM